MAKEKGYDDALLLSPHRCRRPRPQHEDEKAMWGDNNMDTLLQCHVLDGPNFSIGFVQVHTERDKNKDNHNKNQNQNHNNTNVCPATLHVPCNETLGLLPSITQSRIVRLARDELGMNIQRDVYTLQQLLDVASEVFVMSTTRGVIPVTRIGPYAIPAVVTTTVTAVETEEQASAAAETSSPDAEFPWTARLRDALEKSGD
jgi:hypothetical protein